MIKISTMIGPSKRILAPTHMQIYVGALKNATKND